MILNGIPVSGVLVISSFSVGIGVVAESVGEGIFVLVNIIVNVGRWVGGGLWVNVGVVVGKGINPGTVGGGNGLY